MTPESKVRKEIKQFLDFDGWFHFSVIQGFTRRYKNLKGIPDVIAIKNKTVLMIEIKSKTGTLSDDQKEFKKNWVTAGGHHITAYSSDDIIDYLKHIKKWGR